MKITVLIDGSGPYNVFVTLSRKGEGMLHVRSCGKTKGKAVNYI